MAYKEVGLLLQSHLLLDNLVLNWSLHPWEIILDYLFESIIVLKVYIVLFHDLVISTFKVIILIGGDNSPIEQWLIRVYAALNLNRASYQGHILEVHRLPISTNPSTL